MATRSRPVVVTLAAWVVLASGAFLPLGAWAQGKPLTQGQKYCIGMAGVAVGTMEMVQAGGRSWPQVHSELVRVVQQAGWPLGQAHFDQAIEIGFTGVRGGDDPRAVAGFILRECLDYAWYAR